MTLHEPVEVEVQTWERRPRSSPDPPDDRRPGHLQPDPARPAALRKHEVMNARGPRELVAECYRLLGPTETAHLVDGIKTIGFSTRPAAA